MWILGKSNKIFNLQLESDKVINSGVIPDTVATHALH